MTPTLVSAESASASVGWGAGEARAPRPTAGELAAARVRGASRLRLFLSRTQLWGPALVVAMVLGLTVGPGLAVYHGNPTGYVRFGRDFTFETHPPAGAYIDTRTGYDGQFFWALALDPLLMHQSTIAAFSPQNFRLARIGYPALAYILAAGQEDAIPWTLLAINVVTVIALTVAFAAYARRRGWSGWWALAVGLLPGLQFVTMGDLCGGLATALMLGGLMAWERRRRWLAAFLLAGAGLTREPMLLAVVAITVQEGARWWSVRHDPGALRRTARVWPVLAIPAAAFLAWQVYLETRLTGGAVPPGSAFDLPLIGLLRQIPEALRHGLTPTAIWNLALLGAIFAGIAAAFAAVRRRLSAPVVAAALFSAVVLVLPFGSDWGYSRESAPIFAALLLGALELRQRSAIAVCVFMGALGALMPLMIG